MTNFFITTIIFILLVTQKILLLNEESLILLCFIIFVNLGITKLGTSFNDFFEKQSKEIKINLTGSLKKLSEVLFKFKSLNQTSTNFLIKIILIKNYYKNLILLLKNYFLTHSKNDKTSFYLEKLIFLDKVENQTSKLLTITIVKKLNFLIKLKYFYVNSIKIDKFLSLNYIRIRECIHLIDKK